MSGLIVPGDLPDGENTERELFFKWSHCNEWPTQVEKIQRKGLIVMGDLPK
jgi:hypothetical protein